MSGLDKAHDTFLKWFGASFDLDILDAVLAVAAVNELHGDSPWLLVVGGPGAAKTETVSTLETVGAILRSSISSEGALLSATSMKEVSTEATGGLLREIGDKGLLVLKDVTTILSMNRESRASVLAALREIYDGQWTRNVGTDGGRTLEWSGRIVLVGAVTTAWDAAHSVISEMGDRFLLVRMDSTKGRLEASRQAIANTGDEKQMRAELRAAVKGVFAWLNPEFMRLTNLEEILVPLADLVTQARTAVMRDQMGNVIDAHAPEMPTRFAKQLTQVVNGSLALGMTPSHAITLAVRVASDSMPPLRLLTLTDIAAHPYSSVSEVRVRLQKPRTTIQRELEALHMLGLLVVDESLQGGRYALANEEHVKTLHSLASTSHGRKLCHVCALVLDEDSSEYGKHLLCEVA